MTPKESTCALNLRTFPKELKWKCKQKAAAEHKTLGQFVEDELRKATDRTPAKIDQEDKPVAKRKGA
jgi:hypothetical protein